VKGRSTVNSKIKNFSMPLVFLGALLFSITCESILPLGLKSVLYALSLSIKEILIFLLPFVIFSLVFNSISRLGAKALKYILIIVPLICSSNFMNTMLSYATANIFLDSSWNLKSAETTVVGLVPAFNLKIPQLLSNDVALFAGVLLGLVFGIFKQNISAKISTYLEIFAKVFFKVLLPIMPLFIVGTTIKLQCDGILASIFGNYFPVLLAFVLSSYGLVLVEFFILSKFSISKVIRYIKNIVPAIITAFGAMSSAAALPLSIKAAEKNIDNKNNAAIIVPSTVNIHLVGDCFFIPMGALAVMTSFGMNMPSFGTYAIFALHFIVAKFAVAAIPGGGVLVMLPIMQNYLGLNTDMLALVTALYILFDPIITSCNVTGNGAMAIIFDRIAGKMKK